VTKRAILMRGQSGSKQKTEDVSVETLACLGMVWGRRSRCYLDRNSNRWGIIPEISETKPPKVSSAKKKMGLQPKKDRRKRPGKCREKDQKMGVPEAGRSPWGESSWGGLGGFGEKPDSISEVEVA